MVLGLPADNSAMGTLYDFHCESRSPAAKTAAWPGTQPQSFARTVSSCTTCRSATAITRKAECEVPIHCQLNKVCLIFHLWELLLKVKSSATDTLRCLATLSRVSKEGAFLPRSIKLKKSTEIP